MKRLVLTVCLLSIAVDARAAVITYSTDSAAISRDGQLYPGSQTGLTLARFDATIGTLEAVQISFDTSYGASLLTAAGAEMPSGTGIPFPPFIINGHNDAGASATASGTLRIQLNDPSGSARTLNMLRSIPL